MNGVSSEAPFFCVRLCEVIASEASAIDGNPVGDMAIFQPSWSNEIPSNAGCAIEGVEPWENLRVDLWSRETVQIAMEIKFE